MAGIRLGLNRQNPEEQPGSQKDKPPKVASLSLHHLNSSFALEITLKRTHHKILILSRQATQQVAEKVILCRPLKNAQMQGTRNPEE
jgi:hypothetical protein